MHSLWTEFSEMDRFYVSPREEFAGEEFDEDELERADATAPLDPDWEPGGKFGDPWYVR